MKKLYLKKIINNKEKNKMSDFKFKFQMYKHLQENIPNIYSEAKKAADEIGIPKDLRGKFGLLVLFLVAMVYPKKK